MEIWYGFRSTFNRSGVRCINSENKRNGSNLYYIDPKDLLKLPPSHVPISVSLPQFENVDEIAENLEDVFNTFLLGPGSVENIVHRVIYHNNEYYPVYQDGSYITVPEIEKRNFVSRFEELYNKQVLPSPSSNLNSLFFREAPIERIPIASSDQLYVDYVSKTAFIYAAYHNSWLIPFSSRVGFNISMGSSHAILPYWSTEDINRYLEVVNTTMRIPSGHSEWTSSSIKLINGYWYRLPVEQFPMFGDLVSPPNKNPEYIVFNGMEYKTSEVLKVDIPKVDYRLKNLAQTAYGDSLGLVPFDRKYPEARYDDGERRISVKETDLGILVSVEPEQILLYIYPPEASAKLLRSFYIKLWNDGQLLTNYGNYEYMDYQTVLDKSMVVNVDGDIDHKDILSMNSSLDKRY